MLSTRMNPYFKAALFLIRLIAAGFAIFGGLVVLASSVAGTRYRRMREVAILKTVGATRGTLVRMFCTEFAVIGTAAGLMGGALAAIGEISALLQAHFPAGGAKLNELPDRPLIL